MPKYIDAHCHFNPHADYSVHGDVVGVICNSTRQSDWVAIISAAARVPEILPCVGIHPWYVADMSPDWGSHMSDILAAHPNVMVGEIGLDRSRGDFDAQRELFVLQMELAAKYNRTAHIHCVRAWDVIQGVLKNMPHMPPKTVFHEFGGGADIAQALMRYDNVYFSYGPRAVRQTPERIADIPMDRILIETDSYNPQTAAEILSHNVSVIAQIKSMDAGLCADIIYENTTRIITNG